MSEKILPFNGITRHELPPDRLLSAASGKLKNVVLVGFDNDGEFYFASSYADGGSILWLFEMGKKKLMEVGEEPAE